VPSLVGVYSVPQAGLEARLGVHVTIVSGLFVVVVASMGGSAVRLLYKIASEDAAVEEVVFISFRFPNCRIPRV